MQVHNQFNQFMFHDKSYKSRIILLLILLKHIIKIIINETTHNRHMQDSNPSPLNTTKYSQQFELILFHVISIKI